MSVVLRAAAAYWILLIAVRLVGRRSVSMMAPFDLILLFLFGGATIQSVLSQDHSLVGAFSAIATIGLMHIFVSWLKIRWGVIGRMIDGTPVIIYQRGDWKPNRMRHMRVEPQDVMAAMRQNGLERLEQVRYAIVERDGKVSIIPEDEPGS